MAYIVGLLSKGEQDELKKRGWEIEPAERYGLAGYVERLISSELEPCVVFVDNSMFDIMSGPDWEK